MNGEMGPEREGRECGKEGEERRGDELVRRGSRGELVGSVRGTTWLRSES